LDDVQEREDKTAISDFLEEIDQLRTEDMKSVDSKFGNMLKKTNFDDNSKEDDRSYLDPRGLTRCLGSPSSQSSLCTDDDDDDNAITSKSLQRKLQEAEIKGRNVQMVEVHRSNSMSTLPSVYGQRDTNWRNKSMDEDPVDRDDYLQKMVMVAKAESQEKDKDNLKHGEKIEKGKIQHHFLKLLYALADTETIYENLPREEMKKIMENWPLMIQILLFSFSTDLIDQTRKYSFYNKGHYDPPDMLKTSLKILTKFAHVKAFGESEVEIALSKIGIHYPLQSGKDSHLISEATFCITIDKNKHIQTESMKKKLCKTIEDGINNALDDPLVEKWLKGILMEDETVPDYVKERSVQFSSVQFKTLAEINVLDIFPGSWRVFVQLKWPYFPEDPMDVNCMFYIFKILLENLDSVTDVGIDTQKEMKPKDGILRMNIQVVSKWLTWNNKAVLDQFLKDFVDQIRKNLNMEIENIEARLLKNEETLLNNGLTPKSVRNVLQYMKKHDTIEFDLEPPETFQVETLRLKNIPLWPYDKIRIKDLSSEDKFQISELFKNCFQDRIIWEEVASKLNPLRDNNELVDLQKEIKKLDVDASPYFSIIEKYSKKDGTIGGLVECLEKCKTIKKVVEYTSLQEIKRLEASIQEIKQKHFNEWILNYKAHKDVEGCVASFGDFKEAATNSKSTQCFLQNKLHAWNEEMQELVKEGDLIWMWRENKWRPSYAHVGIYVGEETMVHVSHEGLNVMIKKDPIQNVIKESKCFIVKPDPGKLKKMSGTPKERALACVGLQFIYNVQAGSCEVFANCIVNHIWDVETSTIQGKEHSVIDNIMYGLNFLFHGKIWYEKQKNDLLSKLAECLLKSGFDDCNPLQLCRVGRAHYMMPTGDEMTQRRQEMNRYIILNVWEILEGKLKIENSDSCELKFNENWEKEENGRLCYSKQPNPIHFFTSSAPTLFNELPAHIRNQTKCSTMDFVNTLDIHLRSIGEYPLANDTNLLSSTTPATSLCPIKVASIRSEHFCTDESDEFFSLSDCE